MSDEAALILAQAINSLAEAITAAMAQSASGSGGLRIHVTGIPSGFHVYPGGAGGSGH